MNKYQVYIDVPQDGDWDDVAVETMEVYAFNCNDAKIVANIEANHIYRGCYVWEITEEDKID